MKEKMEVTLIERPSKKDPSSFRSCFLKYAKAADMFIAGHYYAEGSPYIITRDDLKDPELRIKVVADVSCDIDGPVACTIRPSTVANPLYGYNPKKKRNALSMLLVALLLWQ